MVVEKINGCRTQVEVLSMENREPDGRMVHFALLEYLSRSKGTGFGVNIPQSKELFKRK